MIPRICVVAFLASAFAFAQLDTNTVTVTASRTVSVQPDQVVFGVSVISGITSSLTDVVNALQPVGITAEDFLGVSSIPQIYGGPVQPDQVGTNQPAQVGTGQPAQLQWSFAHPVALSSTKATVTALTSLQQSMMQNSTGFSLSFSIQGTRVSQQLQQTQSCPLSELLSDAQMQGQKLANVAGASLGSVLAMAGATPNSISTGPYAVAVLGGLTSFPSLPVPSNCSMTVKFSLLH